MGRVTRNKHQLRKIIIALAIGYLVILVMLIFFNSNFLTNYDSRKIDYLKTIETKLNKALNNSEEELSEAIKQLLNEYPMEIYIQKNDKVLFQSIKNFQIENSRDLLNPNAILVEEQGLIDTEKGTLFVWYALYNMPDQIYINSFFSKQTILITCLFFVLLTVSIFTQVVLIKPVQKLKLSLENAEEYRFEEIVDSDDLLNRQFHRFTHKMKNAVQTVSKDYSELERELQLERERIQNLLVIIRALVHDLKSPIHQQLLENEIAVANNVNGLKKFEELKSFNLEQTEMELQMINDILILMDEDVYSFETEKEDFDLPEMILNLKKLFKASIEQKHILFNIDIPEKLMIKKNVVTMKLLIHNIFSNAFQYAESDSEVDVDIVERNNQIILKVRNEATTENIKRMKKSEDLFWALEEKQSKEHQFSSGNGLYLIKELAELLMGEYKLSLGENDVSIEISFQRDEDR